MLDDDISGIRFDRPGFTAMMEEVEAGARGGYIVKGMSRLGRSCLKAGQVMEILRLQSIRLIAIHDGVGSLNNAGFYPVQKLYEEHRLLV